MKAETIDALLGMEPEELLKKLTEEYTATIPVAINMPDDLAEVEHLLSVFSANYIFFTEAALHAEIKKKLLKKNGASKADTDDAISRQKIFETFADIEKSAYNAVSRMMSAYTQRQYEINMSRHSI